MSSKLDGAVFFEGRLHRGIVPEESTWTLEHCGASSLEQPAAETAAAAGRCDGGSGGDSGGGAGRSTAAAPDVGRPPVLTLHLSKMNLELYASGGSAHGLMWWSRLLEGHADIAWDDMEKDYRYELY